MVTFYELLAEVVTIELKDNYTDPCLCAVTNIIVLTIAGRIFTFSSQKMTGPLVFLCFLKKATEVDITRKSCFLLGSHYP